MEQGGTVAGRAHGAAGGSPIAEPAPTLAQQRERYNTYGACALNTAPNALEALAGARYYALQLHPSPGDAQREAHQGLQAGWRNGCSHAAECEAGRRRLERLVAKYSFTPAQLSQQCILYAVHEGTV